MLFTTDLFCHQIVVNEQTDPVCDTLTVQCKAFYSVLLIFHIFATESTLPKPDKTSRDPSRPDRMISPGQLLCGEW